jgi:hypothetical protein
MYDPITTNKGLVAILDTECNKFTAEYFPLHTKQIKAL